ncbi:hypothetical protein [Paracoccus sp. J55]|uniref:hypothetical protein n=1 Tax=Paracoccus sp. J55 TaxID=935849 RepID=UPI001E37C6D3|nr:hypothetical protein [Paracoccus sp. J55]
MDDFYAARSSTKPPLPWTNFSPPFSVAFLAAEEAGFCTGQVYTVDGGRMAKLSLP